MLIIDNIRLSYGKHTVLNGLNLHLQEGLIHGLIGLNGAGKTSLFNVICGYVKPEEGKIIWNDKPLNRKSIALLETQNYFYSNLTGNEYLELFNDKNAGLDISSLQTLFALPLNDLIETYSTGMKKKLALLGVIKMNREIFLLDEPFNGVDLETSVAIKVLIQKLKEQGKTVLLTSHIMETMHGLCDEVHQLEDGRIKKTYLKEDMGRINEEILQDVERRASQLIDSAFGKGKV